MIFGPRLTLYSVLRTYLAYRASYFDEGSLCPGAIESCHADQSCSPIIFTAGLLRIHYEI